MKSVIISAVIGFAFGFLACYLLLDRESKPEQQRQSTAKMVFKSPADNSGKPLMAEKTSLDEARKYAQAYHRPVSDTGGGAPLTTIVDPVQCSETAEALD